jgi:hypothetical protein
MVGEGRERESTVMSSTVTFPERADAMRDADEGRLPEAEAKLDKLIADLLGAGSQRTVLVQTLSDRATVRRYANRWDDALADLTEAERIARALPAIPRLALLPPIIHLRAKLFASRADLLSFKDPAAAIGYLKEARRGSADLRTLRWVPWVADELDSDLAFRSGEWDRAAELALGVATTMRAEGWEVAEARLRRRAGEAFLEMRDLGRAEPELEFAFRFFERNGPPPDLAAAHLALARLAHVRGESDGAWELASLALSEMEAQIRRFRVQSEQQLFVVDKARYYRYAFDIGLAKGGDAGTLRGWAVAERAKSFYLCQLLANAEIPLFAGVEPADIERLGALETAFDTCEMSLGRRGLSSDPERAELEARRASLSRDRQKLLATMMKANPTWAAMRSPQPLDLGGELDGLDRAWVPLGFYWRAEDDGRTLHLFYSDGDRVPHHEVVAWNPKELAVLDAARRRLRGPRVTDDEMLEPAMPASLAEKVLPAGVRDAFAKGQRLLISPHEDLRGLPLHALPLSEEELVIDRWPVQYVPTLALLPLRRKGRRPDRVLIVGCVQDAFGGGMLEDVAEEVDNVEKVWSTARPGRVTKAILPRTGGSVETVGAPVERWNEFDVLHLACHGVFPDGRPFDAALLLGDQQLGASDIFTLQLRCTVVALSACSLGRSDSDESATDAVVDEWAGLYLPFFYAGADILVVSLWRADSRTAVPFMSALHSALSTGAPPAIAYGKAVASVRSRPDSLWANWYLSGMPS